ncbi:MAG TPA: hypothetical protein DCE81_01900 [Cytophagales bacterium]|nr:hypothetical protein [Cytophagales bacterium]
MKIFWGLALTLVSFDLLGQGCSDAGFCTMGAMKPDQPYNKRAQLKLRSFDISFYRGTTTLTPIVYVATAEFNFSLGNKNSFQVKLPYQFVRGKLGETATISDISLCFTRNIFSSDRFDINVSVGGKLPSNNANLTSTAGFPLPMYYQTSLGTYDVISGISLISRNWMLATGIQVPLNQNENNFLWRNWASSTEDQSYIRQYNPANELMRGTDIMLRVERNFRFARFNTSLGLLPIWRLNHDEITNGEGKRVKVAETTGLALSAIATFGFNFDVRSSMRLLLGHKIVQRTAEPDGLTRNLVSSLGYSYRF